mgnify:CR=1 FL=1
MHDKILRKTPIALAVAAALAFSVGDPVHAQEAEEPEGAQPQAPDEETIEEIVVMGRFLSGAESLTQERIELPFSADFLSMEVMARAGDPNIAAALRRVPGLTVVDGRFVYVRGLGERYSSVTVNGAAVPSPELTRSVIPLDLFPTSIVEAVKIQKSPSPDQPASFGGGAIDIRTTSIPDDVVASIEVDVGFNNASDSAGLTYSSSGSPLPAEIRAAIPAYRGDISISNIFNTLNLSGDATLDEARTIHQGLIESLDTGVQPRYESTDPDYGAQLALGNSWYVGEDWQVGVLLNATYSEKWRNENQRREGIGNPETNFVDIDRTFFEERAVGAANVGLSWRDEHSLEAGYFLLRNDQDETRVLRGFDANNEVEDNDQKVEYGTRLEERELILTQISGEHVFGGTPLIGDWLDAVGLANLSFDWFYSDSEANTDIPNQTNFLARRNFDVDTGQTNAGLLDATLASTDSVGEFSFLELDDEVTSYGGNLDLPIEFGNVLTTVSGGWWGSKKSRQYFDYNVNLNAGGVQEGFRTGGLDEVLEPDNLTVENGFTLSLGSDFGTESYIAAQKVDAVYGMADIELTPSWRVTVGARWEDYQQATLPYDLLDFTGNSIINLNNDLQDPNQRLAIREDDTFLSAAVSYLDSGLLGADEYQFRLSFGETVVRPDLREIADVVYLDPELDVRVVGNPNLRTSPIDNFEARGEFFYTNGDSFTLSAFYKDIDQPIERTRTAGSADDIVLTFVNAESGEVYGLELEGLKTLWRGFFVSGNLTLSDSEIEIATGELTGGPTNATRRLTGHSEYVVNTTLGFDSDDGKHSAFLNYNVFGERIFYAGVNGNDDAFEEPFHSLGLVYKYYPTDNIEIGFQWDNILDEERDFEQTNRDGTTATLIEQEVGQSFSLSGKWLF